MVIGDRPVNWAGTVTSSYNFDKKLALNAIETTNPNNVSIIGDPQADLDYVCNSAMCMRKVYLQADHLQV